MTLVVVDVELARLSDPSIADRFNESHEPEVFALLNTRLEKLDAPSRKLLLRYNNQWGGDVGTDHRAENQSFHRHDAASQATRIACGLHQAKFSNDLKSQDL